MITNDPVNHPSHYTDGQYETIDFIEGHCLGFCTGNAVKYLSRAGKKEGNSELQDIEKAIWYLEHEYQQKNPPIIDSDSYARDKNLPPELLTALICIALYNETQSRFYLSMAIWQLKMYADILRIERSESNENH